MSEHHQGSWGARNDAGWWPGTIATDQQSLQHHQHLLHQQQQLAAAAHQQAMQQDARSTAAAAATHQLFTYKMASSFQNPTTTISNASSTSPIGAAGIRGYDYRLGGGMAAGNPAMSAPAPTTQWWYTSQMDGSMQNALQNNMQNVQTSQTANQQSQQAQLVQQHQQAEAHRQQQEAEVQRHQEVQRQQQEAHRQHQEAHRQHQEAQRQHQEAQRHQAEVQAIQQHNQAFAEAQARQQQQQNNHLQQHQQIQTSQQSILQQHQQITTVQAPILTKGRMPRGKAGDARPKGRMTAYAFFVQTCREEHKKKHPEENVVFTEFTKKCAERWKTMLDKEKKRFHEMAEKDKKRYDAEMQNYTPPKGEKTRGKKRKQMKDPNAPKRSLSAFFWFCNDERSKVKSLNPEYGVGDIAKELGRRWSDADPETKGRYEAMAEKDKARYEKEMTAYKKKNNPIMQAPVPEPEEEEEGDEEVDDDDDE